MMQPATSPLYHPSSPIPAKQPFVLSRALGFPVSAVGSDHLSARLSDFLVGLMATVGLTYGFRASLTWGESAVGKALVGFESVCVLTKRTHGERKPLWNCGSGLVGEAAVNRSWGIGRAGRF